MLDTDPEFDRHVAILAEASRINRHFADAVDNAKTDQDIDELVAWGRLVITDAAQEAY